MQDPAFPAGLPSTTGLLLGVGKSWQDQSLALVLFVVIRQPWRPSGEPFISLDQSTVMERWSPLLMPWPCCRPGPNPIQPFWAEHCGGRGGSCPLSPVRAQDWGSEWLAKTQSQHHQAQFRQDLGSNWRGLSIGTHPIRMLPAVFCILMRRSRFWLA